MKPTKEKTNEILVLFVMSGNLEGQQKEWDSAIFPKRKGANFLTIVLKKIAKTSSNVTSL